MPLILLCCFVEQNCKCCYCRSFSYSSSFHFLLLLLLLLRFTFLRWLMSLMRRCPGRERGVIERESTRDIYWQKCRSTVWDGGSNETQPQEYYSYSMEQRKSLIDLENACRKLFWFSVIRTASSHKEVIPCEINPLKKAHSAECRIDMFASHSCCIEAVGREVPYTAHINNTPESHCISQLALRRRTNNWTSSSKREGQ